MAKSSVVLQPPLDQFTTASDARLEVDGDTVLDALRAAAIQAPLLAAHLFEGESLSQYIHVFCDGIHILPHECASHAVLSSEICLLTSIRGG